ncbi:MAG TPA: SprB repeat-containing protein, partial [Bacteroidia bacterium]|nr:SprB repeat-containing protein [Bacteroidia bacterium]
MTTLDRISLTAGLTLLAIISSPLLMYVHLKRLIRSRKKINVLPLALLFLLLLPAVHMQAQLTVSFTGITNNPVCNQNGSITAVASGGTAPYIFQWNCYPSTVTLPATATLTNVGAGNYWVTVTDATGHTGSGSYPLTPIVMINQSATAANCPLINGTATASVSGTAIAPYTYAWSNGNVTTGSSSTSNTISNLAGGTYTCFITDANGCVSSTDSVSYVQSLSSLTSTLTTTLANCNDGTATVIPANGTAPYSYYWNTVPAQTTATAVHLSPNTFPEIVVTDAQGCTVINYASISSGPNAIQSSESETDATCPSSNGSVSLTVSGGTAPYTYSWSNGGNTASISNLAYGNYTVQVSDAAGCILTMIKYVGQNSPVLASLTTTPPSACNSNDGTATVVASGGQAPYTYSWNTSQTTSSILSLAPGYYSVQVKDANGCPNNYAWSTWAQIQRPPSCYSTVSGTVYNDVNGNCIVDPGDNGMPYTILNISPALYTTTDYYGNYSIDTLTAGTVTLAHTPPANWTQICPNAPSSYSVNTVIGNTYAGNNFFDKPNSLFDDLSVSLSQGLARPGFDEYYTITVYNRGTATLTPSLDFVHDPAITFTGSSPAASNYNASTHTATFSVPTLAPFQYASFQITCHVPPAVPIGTILHGYSHVLPLAGDVNPLDNTDSASIYVVGSYDPNAKSVLPRGNGPLGYISTHDKQLKYTIHFQNTGTDTAHLVVIKDTLDPHLDITSFHMGASSATVTWDISGPGI